nr:outer membrane beta-barrel family protein [Arcticibacterium luteifluviistationis]
MSQGIIDARFLLDAGVKKLIQNGKGELFLNATELLNTMVIKAKVTGNNFNYISKKHYETQVIRLGYSY